MTVSVLWGEKICEVWSGNAISFFQSFLRKLHSLFVKKYLSFYLWYVDTLITIMRHFKFVNSRKIWGPLLLANWLYIYFLVWLWSISAHRYKLILVNNFSTSEFVYYFGPRKSSNTKFQFGFLIYLIKSSFFTCEEVY